MGNKGRCDPCAEDCAGVEVSSKTIFQKIIDRELPAEILFEDKDIICIKDKYPAMPIHILIITKKVIPSMQQIEEKDFHLLGKMVQRAQALARELGIEDNYRLVTNVGAKSGQSIYHLHFHLLSGEKGNTSLTREG